MAETVKPKETPAGRDRTAGDPVAARLTIKGLRDGLLIVVPDDSDWPACLVALQAKIGSQAAFFRGARVILEVGNRLLTTADIGNAMRLLNEREMTLMGLVASLPDTRLAAAEQGLRVMRARPGTETPRAPDTSGRRAVSGDPALLVERTLRSGQWVQYTGHVVIRGDVNPGAEIAAGGNIIVWGKLRGVVHAGAGGNDNAIVCALDLAPMQLRIGKHIARAPEERPDSAPTPEMALVRDDQIVVETWS